MKKTLFLIDGMALAFRSFYALYARPRINSRGMKVSSVYGFTNTLLKLMKDYGMKYAAVAMDTGEPTFRSTLDPEYKAHRPPAPEDIISNLPLIREVVESLGIPYVEGRGVEADDVIGTLARKAEQDGGRAIIVSSDKDFQQLLSPSVSIYKPRGRGGGFEHITDDSFREDTKLAPGQFIDALALMGDKADNVPGIRGIGPKTAYKLLLQYGTLEELLKNASSVRFKRPREGLLAGADQARLSKALVTIKLDVDVTLNWDEARCAQPNNSDTAKVLRRLEFNSMLERIGATSTLSKDEGAASDDGAIRRFDAAASHYHSVTNEKGLIALENSLSRQKTLSWFVVYSDVKHSDKPPIWSTIRGLAVSWARGTARYIPLPLPDGTSANQILRRLAPVFSNPNVATVGHDIKPFIVLLGLENIQVAGGLFDTEIAHYLLVPDLNHDLPFVAREQLNYEVVEWDNKKLLAEADPKKLMIWACERADLALQLSDRLSLSLKKKGVDRIATEMEFPLIYSLADMEKAGVLLNQDILKKTEEKVTRAVTELQEKIFTIAGKPFKIGSPKQIGEVLFTEMGLPVRQKTASGKPSTKESVLIQLAVEHEICGLILDWRKASKILGTYVQGLNKWIFPGTKRVHTVFNQASAATGRLSSSDPALQNIPIRQATGRELRRAFVAPKNWTLLSADYSQIELRILAHMSGDNRLMEIFHSGRDPHTETAARVHNVSPEEVIPEQRNKAKAVNYGIPYGVSATGLSTQLRCSVKEARELVEAHRTSFPEVHQFLSHQVEKARAKGYAQSLLGRRRYLPALKARNPVVRSAAERIAVNMPIQGSQADMIKRAMVTIHSRIKHEGLRMRMLLQIHDELLFEVPYYEESIARTLVRDAMVNALELKVPVEVNLNTGATWLDAH